MILILGSTGYIGQAFVKYFKSKDILFQGVSRSEVDYTNRTVLLKYLESIKPDFLINCAGYTGKPNVDACETDKTNCLIGNAILPGIIAEVCQKIGLTWGHVSSGCIYNGESYQLGGFKEEDEPNFSFRRPPCSFYSGTKALGEEILKDYSNCYIWRLRIPFEHIHSSRNFISKVLAYPYLLNAANSISNVYDFVNSCYTLYLKQAPLGTYNVTNPGSITTLRLTELIAEEYDRRVAANLPNPFKKNFAFFKDEAEFLSKAAKTPRSNCVLNTDKIQNAGIHMPHVEESLRYCLQNWIY